MRGITSRTVTQTAMWDQLSNIITFRSLLLILILANIVRFDFAWSYDNSEKKAEINTFTVAVVAIRSTVSVVSRSVNN